MVPCRLQEAAAAAAAAAAAVVVVVVVVGTNAEMGEKCKKVEEGMESMRARYRTIYERSPNILSCGGGMMRACIMGQDGPPLYIARYRQCRSRARAGPARASARRRIGRGRGRRPSRT